MNERPVLDIVNDITNFCSGSCICKKQRDQMES